jgi:hypothetical protein
MLVSEFGGHGDIERMPFDGGYSGGTLDRPALQRLLADIADAKVGRVRNQVMSLSVIAHTPG